MLGVSLGKVRLIMKVRGYIKSIVLINILYIL